MKNYKSFRKTISASIIFGVTLISIISCTRKDEDILDSNKTPQLIIQVAGLKAENIIESTVANSPEKISKVATSKGTIFHNGNISTEIENTTGFNLETTTIQAPIEATNYLAKDINAFNTLSPIASTQPMTAGKTYRIIIYKNNEPKLWKSLQATSGQAIKLDITKGDIYKWYAFSYNNNDNLPVPTDSINPIVEASADKDLLYATGTNQIPLNANGTILNPYVSQADIVFDHKMAQVKVRIDGRRLAKYADIHGLRASFSENNYIKSGTFNIKANSMENLNVVPTTEIFNTGVNPDTIWEATYYTADPQSLTSYKVKITDLPITFKMVDPSIASINLATFTNSSIPPPNLEKTHTYTDPKAGQTLLAQTILSYTLPSKRILHMSSNYDYGYSMERGAGWQMINDLRNFGNLPNSLVRMQPYANGQGVWKGGTTTDDLANWFITGTSDQTIIDRLKSTDPDIQPDIFITGSNMYFFSPALQDAIVEYINKGGVMIMMFEGVANGARQLIAKIYDIPETDLTLQPLPEGGSMYPIVSTVNDPVTNGPFGDVRLENWGEDSAGCTGIKGLPESQTTVYSYGQPINYVNTPAFADAVSMFRHKTKNFFYLGDGGLTSFGANNNTSLVDVPFRFNPTTGRPIPKPYGYEYLPKGYTAGSKGAYNGIIAGNVMLWAGELTEFNGIKKWRYKPD